MPVVAVLSTVAVVPVTLLGEDLAIPVGMVSVSWTWCVRLPLTAVTIGV